LNACEIGHVTFILESLPLAFLKERRLRGFGLGVTAIMDVSFRESIREGSQGMGLATRYGTEEHNGKKLTYTAL
jgi:hypothetical protein